MIRVSENENYRTENMRGGRSGRRRASGRRRTSNCEAQPQTDCPKVYEVIERRSFELFPLKAMNHILSEGRLPEEKFRICEEFRILDRVIREQQKVMLTRLIMGRVEEEYKILFIRADVLFYSCSKERNKIYGISFSRLRRENWFIRFYNQWKYIC